MRRADFRESLSVKTFPPKKSLNSQFVLGAACLHGNGGKIFCRKHPSQNPVVIKFDSMFQCLFKKIVVNGQELYWSSINVNALRHDLIRKIAALAQSIIYGLQR